jgi:exopolysaccharide biosynthesis polyprenyl glycosylphosphotransferase
MRFLVLSLETAWLALFVGGGVLLLGEIRTASPLAGSFTLAHLIAPAFCCAVAFYLSDAYDLAISACETARRLLRGLTLASVLLFILYTILPNLRMMRSASASTFLVLATVIIVSALIHYGVRGFVGARDEERILILGTGRLALMVTEALHARRRPFSVYFLREEAAVNERLPGPTLGSITDLAEAFKKCAPRRVIVALSGASNDLPVRELLAFRSRGGIVEAGAHFFERITRKLALEDVTPSDIVLSEGFRLTPWKLRLRREASVVIAVVGLILTAPLFPLIALAIRLTSHGPIFFVQERVGLNGKPFRLYKFRTMQVTAGSRSEWERDNADRITLVGRALRKFHLDELPQFWNILRGDMNIVGPRPQPVSNQGLFALEIPYYSLRALILPGLTGWAQIRNGYVQDLDGEIEKMRYDLYYISHSTLWLDFKILLETIRVVLFPTIGSPPIGDRFTAPELSPRESGAECFSKLPDLSGDRTVREAWCDRESCLRQDQTVPARAEMDRAAECPLDLGLVADSTMPEIHLSHAKFGTESVAHAAHVHHQQILHGMTTSREHAISDVEADAHHVTLGSDREAQGVEADCAESLSLTQTFREPRARQNQVDQGTTGLRMFAGVDADQRVTRRSPA